MKFEPLYLKVKEKLRADFQHSSSGSAERLPSLNELQEQYRVSRPTLSKALAALTAEGVLVKEDGRGAFALAPAKSAPIPDNLLPNNRSTIGYVAPLTDAELPQDVFRGIDRIAHRRDVQVMMASSRDNVANERLAALEMIAAGAKGLILYPTIRQGEDLQSDYLRHEDLGVPVVLIDTCRPEQGHGQVVFDNKRAGSEMTHRLIEQGHRRIGVIFLTEEAHHPSLDARFQGYRQALLEAGIAWDDTLIQRVPPQSSHEVLESAVKDLLALPDRPTALIASNDLMAIELIEFLQFLSIHVPDDIQIVGFDNSFAARHYQPIFSTTSPDFQLMGEVACEMLLDSLSQGTRPRQTYLLPVPLLVRTRLHRYAAHTEGISAPHRSPSHTNIGRMRESVTIV